MQIALRPDSSAWRSVELLQRAIDAIPDPMFVKDRDYRYVTVNDSFGKLVGHSPSALIGKNDYDFFPAEQVAVFREQDEKVFASGQIQENDEELKVADGTNRAIRTRKYPIRNEAGEIIGLSGIINDLTPLLAENIEKKREVETLLVEKDQYLTVIEAQKMLLEQLSIPVVQLWHGVLLLPLIGVLSAERAEQAMSGLLTAIGNKNARFLIIDVTGVPYVDQAGAAALLRAVQAAALLGCESVVVGIWADAARMLLKLDVDFSRLATRATLERGLEYALSRMSYRIVKVAETSK